MRRTFRTKVAPYCSVTPPILSVCDGILTACSFRARRRRRPHGRFVGLCSERPTTNVCRAPVYTSGMLVVRRLQLMVPACYPLRLIRTSLMLTLACCYLMWMVTYLAQLHPLIGESAT